MVPHLFNLVASYINLQRILRMRINSQHVVDFCYTFVAPATCVCFGFYAFFMLFSTVY